MDHDALARRRIQYETDGFDVADADPDPVVQFGRWYDAVSADLPEPHAMVVATVDADGGPEARTVLLRGIDGRGLTFFTNYRSAKGRALAVHPVAEALFLWLPVHRQVRVRGEVVRVDPVESDEYFATRPRGSQVASAASPQSEVVADRAELERRVAEVDDAHAGQPVPRPDHWGGYRLVPQRWEFWQGRPNRLHDRVRYRRGDPAADEAWVRERLAP